MGRRYKCPYCDKRDERNKLVTHIENKHADLMPKGYSGTRVVFEMINHKTFGICRVCKKQTQWNEKAGRFDTLCGNPKCKEKMREEYKKNMLRVRGTYNILNDPEQQKKMLANRKISGQYKFQDGGVLTYTGSYEQKFLEFMDLFMNIPSKDIMAPGPTLEYTYNGEKHFYITDFLYVNFNLIIEVKDGGSNPNTKNSPGMIASREKTLEKEKLITEQGIYNYVRLTDNNFVQLVEVFMELKERAINGDTSLLVRVNENSEIINENNDLISTLIDSVKDPSNIKEYHGIVDGSTEEIIEESIKNAVNDKGEKVPEVCPKCGEKIAVFIQGEPVFLCKGCKKFFGVVPFHNKKKSKKIKESFNPFDFDIL